jgi:ubiquinone/menaquinone biosynthesis C-methylase UbiE
LVAELGLAPGSRVCDVAAGTGKLTELLVPVRAELVALDPVPGMRAMFRRKFPDIPLVAGVAEGLPFMSASLDAVLVAQGWHWFDHDRAGAEMARVVRAGGGLGLVWNARDRSVGWVDEVWSVIDRVEKRAPWRDHEHWRESAHPIPGFGPMRTAEFRHTQPLTPHQVVQRIASVSHVATLPDAHRAAVLEEVRTIVLAQGESSLELPYRVDCIAYVRD